MEKAKKILAVIKFIYSNVSGSHKIKRLDDGDYFVADNVPYQCQFATPELAADILEKRMMAENDPSWESFGFKDEKEYAYWSFRVCGIACLKMILDFYNLGNNKTIAELTDEGVRRGGYKIERDEGWFFKPFLEQASFYGLKGFVGSFYGFNLICDLILNKKFFIASVNPAIVRFDKDVLDSKPGGHLALVIGFKIKNKKIKGFYLNNPSGKSEETRRKAFVPIDIFKKAYSKRGIAVWK